MQAGALELMAVMLGGALGGVGRLAVGNAVGRRLGTHFPWGTLAVNLSGALAMGWLAATLGLPGNDTASPAWSLLAVGLLGGYTTVSSFSLQALTLWRQGQVLLASAYVAATLLAGLGAVALGLWLAGGMR